MSILNEEIEFASAEEQKSDLERSSGGMFVTEPGVYTGTVEKAFISKTKKGGYQLNLHIGGDNRFETILYPVSKKNGKLVTTSTYGGKTSSLPDYKMLKQLLFVTQGKAMSLFPQEDADTVTLKAETIKYKAYGKEVEVEAETITDVIGKEIHFAVRFEERYNYEDGEEDRTDIKRNDDGDPLYDKRLYAVYSKKGKTPMEIFKKEEPTTIEKDRDFLEKKGIKKVKLEAPANDFEVVEEGPNGEEVELDF